MRENLKNLIIVILFLVIIFGVLFIVSEKNSKSSTVDKNTTTSDTSSDNQYVQNITNESEAVKEEEKRDFVEVSVNKYLELYESDNYSVVLIGRPTCHYCQIAEPIIRNVAYKNNLDINYLNTDNIDEDGEAKLVSSDDFFKNFGTPTLLVVKNSKIVDKIEGIATGNEYTEFFQKYGFIK